MTGFTLPRSGDSHFLLKCHYGRNSILLKTDELVGHRTWIEYPRVRCGEQECLDNVLVDINNPDGPKRCQASDINGAGGFI